VRAHDEISATQHKIKSEKKHISTWKKMIEEKIKRARPEVVDLAENILRIRKIRLRRYV
jgi:hypothetical protein